jgi:hypothetical protein
MPQTQVHFYQELDGTVPVLEWLRELAKQNRLAAADCLARIQLLVSFGHELRRPHADYLRDGIYELRVKRGHVQMRILYFFHGRQVAVLASALTKEREIPAIEIDRALQRRNRYEQNPRKHQSTRVIPRAQDL